MKEVKKKAVAGLELVGAGALLTGGSVLMERFTEDNSLSISSQDIVYNLDISLAKFKFKSLSKGKNKMCTWETLGWVIFGFFIILFIIPVIKVIKKILKICHRSTDKYNLESKTTEEPTKEAKSHFKHRDHDRMEDESESESSPQDMEKAWVDIDRKDSETAPESVIIQDKST